MTTRPNLWLTLGILTVTALTAPRAARSVENGVTGGFNTSDPATADIPNWNGGWGSPSVDGWNYVGTVNGGSGDYLGDGWVITAGHVGAGDFNLGGATYSYVPGSVQGISSNIGQADVTIFEIATAPALPALNIAATTPSTPNRGVGSPVVMIGYGGGQGETWGFNTVTNTNLQIQVNGFPYDSYDFATAYGNSSYPSGHGGFNSVTNDYYLVVGDSGGGDFIFNAATGQWTLAGINEAVDSDTNNSYMVDLSAYASQINAITGVPEPAGPAWLLGGALLCGTYGLRAARRSTDRR